MDVVTTPELDYYKMAESMELEDTCEHHLLPLESIKVIGESIGLSSLDDEVCKRLTEDLEFRLKEVMTRVINENYANNFFV